MKPQRKPAIAKAFAAIIGLMIAVATMGVLHSCAKGDNMGDIRGFYILQTIQYPDGTVTAADKLYYGFDENIVQLSDYGETTMHQGIWTGTVTGEFPDYTFNFPYDTDVPQNMAKIAPWGIDESPVKVHVETLNSKSLVMKVGANRLTLRRF